MTLLGEYDAGSPGSNGASPYLRRTLPLCEICAVVFELGDGIFPGSDIGVAGRKLPKDDMRFSDCAIGAGGDGESDASNKLRKPGSKIAGEMRLHKHMSSMTQAMR
jgi:hypothetical protein